MKILINKRTLTESSNAGSTVSHVRGNSTININTNFALPKELSPDLYFIRTNIGEYVYEYRMTNEYYFTRVFGYMAAVCKKNKSYKFNYEIQNNIQTISHPPIPKYSFKYTNPLLTCGNCKFKIRLNAIEDGLCPKCNQRYFPTLIYETLEEALNR